MKDAPARPVEAPAVDRMSATVDAMTYTDPDIDQLITARDGGCFCAYCLQPLTMPSLAGVAGPLDEITTIDHLDPRSRGGSDELANLVHACALCNSRKGARTFHEFTGYAWLGDMITTLEAMR